MMLQPHMCQLTAYIMQMEAVTSSYICKTASTGNAPSSGGTLHASWDYLAQGQSYANYNTR